MAVNRTQQSGLTIALIVFVILTFVLAAATYFGFSGWNKAHTDNVAAESQAKTDANELRKKQQDIESLRALLGATPDMSLAAIELNFRAIVEKEFAGFTADSYSELLTKVRDAIRNLSGQVKNAQGEAAGKAAELQKKLRDTEEERDDARAAASKADDAAKATASDFTARREQYEDSLASLNEELDTRRKEAATLRALESEIAKFDDYIDLVSAPQRQSFLAADATQKVGKVHSLLRDLQQAIRESNDLLARMKVADPAAQRAIAAVTAADDRIDGFDGRIVDVDPRSGTVTVASRTTAGLRPGLVLHVFNPADPRPEFGNRKAVVQITEVEGPTLARASIQRETDADPILAGDGVSSSLWSAGAAPDVVIVGFADVDQDGRSDRERLADLVRRAGGRVQDGVTSSTAMVVDLGSPTGPDLTRIAPDWPTEKKQREQVLKEAKAYGIRVKGTPELLDMLGLAPDSFTVGRFPRQRDAQRLPPVR